MDAAANGREFPGRAAARYVQGQTKDRVPVVAPGRRGIGVEFRLQSGFSFDAAKMPDVGTGKISTGSQSGRQYGDCGTPSIRMSSSE